MLYKRISPVTLVVLLVLSLFVLQSVYAACDDEAVRKREIKMGRDASVRIEKEHKLVTDLELVDWVNKIGQDIGAIANRVKVEAGYGSSDIYEFDYRFKILDDKSINAFSLPGGYIYVNKGLLDYVQSDHELAGVLAHEIAHSAHRHMTHLLKEQSRLDGQLALVLLAGMLTRVDANDLGNMLVGAQLVRIATSSGYGQKAEIDADTTAVTYMIEAGYNPVGLLTFMERLASDQIGRPEIDLGILQTHPSPRKRAKMVSEQVRSLGMPINRRAVADAVKAETERVIVKGQSVMQVKLGDYTVFEPASLDGTLTSEHRADAIVTKINQLLDAEPVLREVTVSESGKEVLIRGKPIIVVTEQDCALYEKPADEIAEQAADVLRRVIWQEMVARMN